jgi:hypothetical protein
MVPEVVVVQTILVVPVEQILVAEVEVLDIQLVLEVQRDLE